MKRNLLLIALILMVSQAFGQEYYAIKRTGGDKGYVWNTTSSLYSYTSNVIATGSNDVLSSTLTIPFSWSFYGKSYTSLKASDNGYITFDPNETVSNHTNGSLPSTSAPKSAIFAFWTDLVTTTFSSNIAPQVRTYVYGSAPNRQFGIEWVYCSLNGQTVGNYYAIFTIRLFEAGGFDIIHEFTKTPSNGADGKFKATIGVNNADGTKGYMFPGSPNLDGQAFNGGTGSPSLATKFDFQFGVQPATDAANLYTYLRENVASSASTPITGVLANYGSKDIKSMDLNYQIGNGAVVKQSLDLSAPGSSIAASGGQYFYSHGTPWTGGKPGQVNDIKIWASNINGNKDEVPTNDTLTSKIMANNGVSPLHKRVLLEEGSGAWCGFCPDGHRILKKMLSDYNTAASGTQLVGVVLHNGDGFTLPNGDSVNSVFQVGYPFGTVDRYKFADQNNVGMSRDQWEPEFTTKLTQTSPVDVYITNKSWNPTTRQITFTVKASFSDYWQGDIRFNGYVIEDAVRGANTATQSLYWYTQHNYYSKNDPSYHGAGGASHPLYNKPDTLYGYFHNHAVLKLIGGSWGNKGINAVAAPGDEFTRTYTYTLPATTSYVGNGTNKTDDLYSTVSGQGMYKPDDIRLVGYVFHYNNDGTKMEVLNAAETKLIGWDAGIAPQTSNISSNIFPNPTNGITTVNFNMPQAGNASIEVINAIGQRVELVKQGNFAAGTQNVEFDATNYSNGVYFVKISSGDNTSTQRLVVVK